MGCKGGSFPAQGYEKGTDMDTAKLAEALRTAGYPYVTVITDGFDGWQSAGGPTEGGA